MSKKPCDLAGLSVLVTRAEAQADAFCELIQDAHGRPVRFPALEILGPSDKKGLKQQLSDLSKIDRLIFVSANAVRYAFPHFPNNIPVNLEIAAVGKATAAALEDCGLDATLLPDEQMNSEGLLALPALQAVEGKTILIVRGNGGRELLKDTLTERGASVSYAEAYRRQLPLRNASNLVQNWSSWVDVVTVTSVELLKNLCQLIGDDGIERLKQTPLAVISERIAEYADEIGCEAIYISDQPSDAALLKTVCEINRELLKAQ